MTAAGPASATHWSVVLAAGRQNSPYAHEAMEKLCRAYWPPLYAYVRSRGHSPHDAQDLTQEFFGRLLEGQLLSQVQPTGGRFRSWLLVVMNHFLAHEWEKSRAQKRGGGVPPIPLDEALAEKRFEGALAAQQEPEKMFDREWALAVLDAAAARLRSTYADEGRSHLYEQLKPFVSRSAEPPTYLQVAASLNMTESAMKSAIFRLRQRYQQIVREEISETVAAFTDVDDELRYLLEVIRG